MQSTNLITVLLVDDHPLYHAGLTSVLQALRPDYQLLGAPQAEAGMQVLQSQRIDLLLVDIQLPGRDGFEAIVDYGRAFPQIPRMLISGREDAATQARASRSGASGFISKAWPVERLMLLMDRVLAGGSGFDAADAPASKQGRAADLTLRQIEVLSLLSEGKCNKDIARQLEIADRTVRAHLTDLFQILGVSSRTQAILQAQQMGLVR